MTSQLLYKIWHPHGPWLELGSVPLEEPFTIQQAHQMLDSLSRFNDGQVLATGILSLDSFVELREYPHLRKGEAWENEWADAQARVQAAINLKRYGLRTGDGFNLACHDFRCRGEVEIVRGDSGVFMRCPSRGHVAGDPYSGRGYCYSVEDKLDLRRRLDRDREMDHKTFITEEEMLTEYIIPSIAKHLDRDRGTRAQAHFKFDCWRRDVEAGLRNWKVQ